MDKVFRQAASGALIEWGIEGELEDLVQDLWLWYQERPNTQRLMAELSKPEQITTAKMHAHQILSEKVLGGNVATGKVVYSVDSVKDALRDESTNKQLPGLLELGLEAVQRRDDERDDAGKPRGYAEAIRSRYTDGIVPPQGSAAEHLSQSLKSLTEEINVLHLTLNDRGRNAMFPELRKSKGHHSDPTGELACTFVKHPDLPERHEFYQSLSLDLLLKGAHAQPIRWDVQRNAEVRDVPGAGDSGDVPAREADAS